MQTQPRKRIQRRRLSKDRPDRRRSTSAPCVRWATAKAESTTVVVPYEDFVALPTRSAIDRDAVLRAAASALASARRSAIRPHRAMRLAPLIERHSQQGV